MLPPGQYVCLFMYACLCMLVYVCLCMYACLCMLVYVCLFMYAWLLGFYDY